MSSQFHSWFLTFNDFFLLLLLLLTLHLALHLLLLLVHRPRQPKIAELDLAEILSDEYVLWFEVAVQHLALLAVVEAEQYLEDDEFDLAIVEDTVGFEQFLSIGGQVIQHQRQLLAALILHQYLLEVDDVGVLQLPQQQYFPEDPQRLVLVVQEVFDLLDGYLLASVDVDG